MDGDLLWILVAVATRLAMWRGGTELGDSWQVIGCTTVWYEYFQAVRNGRQGTC